MANDVSERVKLAEQTAISNKILMERRDAESDKSIGDVALFPLFGLIG